MKKPMWTFEEALEIVQRLEQDLRAGGYHVGMTGGVLLTGDSDHDLDLIVYPHDSTCQNYVIARDILICFGLTLDTPSHTVKATWAKKGSNDQKHVEVYRTEGGKRIDILLLS